MPKPSWRTSASKKERLESLGEERVLLRFRLGSFADSRDPFAVRHQVGNELIPASSRHGTNPQGAHQVTHPPLDGSFPEDRPGEGAPELGGWAHVFNEPPLSERPPGERDQDDPRDPEQHGSGSAKPIQTTASIESRASLKTAPDLNPAHTSQASRLRRGSRRGTPSGARRRWCASPVPTTARRSSLEEAEEDRSLPRWSRERRRGSSRGRIPRRVTQVTSAAMRALLMAGDGPREVLIILTVMRSLRSPHEHAAPRRSTVPILGLVGGGSISRGVPPSAGEPVGTPP